MTKRDLKKAIKDLGTIATQRGGASELAEIGRRLGIDFHAVFAVIKTHATEIETSR